MQNHGNFESQGKSIFGGFETGKDPKFILDEEI